MTESAASEPELQRAPDLLVLFLLRDARELRHRLGAGPAPLHAMRLSGAAATTPTPAPFCSRHRNSQTPLAREFAPPIRQNRTQSFSTALTKPMLRREKRPGSSPANGVRRFNSPPPAPRSRRGARRASLFGAGDCDDRRWALTAAQAAARSGQSVLATSGAAKASGRKQMPMPRVSRFASSRCSESPAT